MSPAGTGPSPRAGDLLTLIAGDLHPCRLERRSDTAAVVTAPDGSSFELSVRIERRKLMTLQETAAHVAGAPTSVTEPAAIELRHTGQLRRTGMTARVRGSSEPEVAELRDRLLASERLRAGCLPLDFTGFVVLVRDGRWSADIRLMGASHVRTRIPPGGSYVRFSRDQLDALLETIAALRGLLGDRDGGSLH